MHSLFLPNKLAFGSCVIPHEQTVYRGFSITKTCEHETQNPRAVKTLVATALIRARMATRVCTLICYHALHHFKYQTLVQIISPNKYSFRLVSGFMWVSVSRMLYAFWPNRPDRVMYVSSLSCRTTPLLPDPHPHQHHLPPWLADPPPHTPG